LTTNRIRELILRVVSFLAFLGASGVCVHPLEFFLVMLLDGLSLELEGGGDEAGLGRPQLRADGESSGQLEAFQSSLASVAADLAQQSL